MVQVRKVVLASFFLDFHEDSVFHWRDLGFLRLLGLRAAVDLLDLLWAALLHLGSRSLVVRLSGLHGWLPRCLIDRQLDVPRVVLLGFLPFPLLLDLLLGLLDSSLLLDLLDVEHELVVIGELDLQVVMKVLDGFVGGLDIPLVKVTPLRILILEDHDELFQPGHVEPDARRVDVLLSEIVDQGVSNLRQLSRRELLVEAVFDSFVLGHSIPNLF